MLSTMSKPLHTSQSEDIMDPSASPPLDDIFAIVEPLSNAASDAVKCRDNKGLFSATHCHPPAPPQITLIMNYALLFGRRGISFGSSRSNEVWLPQAPDVEDHHFQLQLDIDTAGVVFVDTSDAGAWIVKGSNLACHVQRDLCPLNATVCIHFGSDDRFRFRISPVQYTRRLEILRQLLTEYRRSVSFLISEPACMKHTVVDSLPTASSSLTRRRRRSSDTTASPRPAKRHRSVQVLHLAWTQLTSCLNSFHGLWRFH